MKNGRGLIRTIAMLVCLVMIGTLLPAAAGAELPNPVLTGAVAEGEGIRVTWNAVAGADGYRVFRKVPGGSWAKAADVTGTSYKDTKATENVTYSYTVRAMAGGVIVSGYDKIGVSAAWSKNTAGFVATPKLVSAKAETNGIRFKWQKVSGATGYRIFRKTGNGNWVFLVDVGNVDNYLNTGLTSGTKYTYTVRAMVSGYVRSDYDKKGLSATWKSSIAPGNIAAPKLKNAVAEGTGIRVTWNAVAGASAYRVYRRQHGKKAWNPLVDVTGTTYRDNATSAGVTYDYTVRCLNADANPISSYDDKGVSGMWKNPVSGKLANPILKTAKSSVGGVLVTWDTVYGADGYRIFRKTLSSAWKAIADVGAVTSYKDTTTADGTTYIYTVRAMQGGVIASGYDTVGIKCLFYATPKLTGAKSASNGITVSWSANKLSPMYLIYRKSGSSDWKRLAYTTSTSYTDTKVTAGTEYTYTVRAIANDKETPLSDYDHTGIKGTFATKSAISALSNELNGVKITWAAVNGAANYQVLRRTGEGGWIELTTTAGTTYTDTQAVNNTTHYYRVRAKNAAGDFIGTDDTNGLGQTYYVAPTLVACERSGGGLRTTWEAVAGISNYIIYRKYGVGDWEKVGTSTSTYYTDFTPPSGTFCYYTVRCANASGNPVSAFRTPGVGQTSYMDQPILSAAVNNNGSITVSWNSVDKATNYRVYRRTGDKTSWDKVVNNTTALSWTDTDVLKGKTYYYSVCVLKADGSEELSEFNSTGVMVTYYDPPTLTAISNAKNGVYLKWSAVDYVGTYAVYRMTGNDVTWKNIGTVSGTEFTDTGVVSNAHYTYAIRSTVSGAVASANSNTKDITYYAAPKMTGISNGNGSVNISWNQEAGIDTYRVYRSTNGGTTWTNLTDVGATSYNDAGANTVGTKYTYAVVCVKDGAEVSAKNTPVSITYVAPVVNVKAVSAGTRKAKITWTTVIGNDGYDVYRKTYNSGWTKVGTVTGGSLVDTTPAAGTYFYYVVAVKNGSSSAASAQATVTVN